MAIKNQTKLFYRAIRELQANKKMLYAKNKRLHDPVTGILQKTTEDGETHPCRDCGTIFKDGLALQKHRTFTCSNSKFEYRPDSQSSESLTSHNYDKNIRSPVGSPEHGLCENTEGGDFQCEECPQSFALKSNLVRHQIVHESRRRFSCAHCDRRYTDLSNLQRHLRSQHHGARCHACLECGKTFATLSGLKQHQHIHSSVKPFQCEVCLKAYTQFSNLCRHKRMHTECRQQSTCKDCGQVFSTITSFSKHRRFCEGALKTGLRRETSFGTDAKLCQSPFLLNGSHAVSFSPALAMGLFNIGTPFPFYSQLLGTLPMFPARHSLAAFTTLPSGSMTSNEMAPLTPRKPDLSLAVHYDNRVPDGSDGGSEVMSESDLDNIPSDTESEQSIRQSQQTLNTSTHTDAFTMSKPTAFVLSALPSPKCNLSPRIKTQTTLPRQGITSPSAFTNVETCEQPLELSNPSDQCPRTSPSKISLSTFKKDGKLIDGEQPLDLSQGRGISLTDSSRKTHVFGEPRTPIGTAESRFHYAYPQFSEQLLMEHALRVAETKDQSTKSYTYLPFTQFPFSGSKQYPVGMNPFSFVNPVSPKSSTSATLMSMSVLSASSPQINGYPDLSGCSPQSGQFATCTKINDRYSCKFCNKIFPRSANLTRHLRTHTGEQPYKCKYCDRSFSISSNLQRHVRNIHDKEKPFRCTLCDRCFGQQTNLDRHLKKHEIEESSMIDLPEHIVECVAKIDDKNESYFSEIHNVIGKATSDNKTFINHNIIRASEQKNVTKKSLSAVDDKLDEEIDPILDDFDDKAVKSDEIDG